MYDVHTTARIARFHQDDIRRSFPQGRLTWREFLGLLPKATPETPPAYAGAPRPGGATAVPTTRLPEAA